MNTKYDAHQVARELDETALGAAHHGNALRVAKDHPQANDDDRAMLDRYLTGRNSGGDHLALQQLAIKLRQGADTPTAALGDEKSLLRDALAKVNYVHGSLGANRVVGGSFALDDATCCRWIGALNVAGARLENALVPAIEGGAIGNGSTATQVADEAWAAVENFLAKAFRQAAEPHIEAINEAGCTGADETSKVFDQALEHLRHALASQHGQIIVATPHSGDGPADPTEAAKAYIRDWCPDHVKDYIDSLGPKPEPREGATLFSQPGGGCEDAWAHHLKNLACRLAALDQQPAAVGVGVAELKRYELRLTRTGDGGEMRPDPKGGWVAYRDIFNLAQKPENLTPDERSQTISRLRKVYDALRHADSEARAYVQDEISRLTEQSEKLNHD